MTTETAGSIGRTKPGAISQAAGEPAWMADARRSAWELADTLELPRLEKIRIERWSLNEYGEYRKPEALQDLSQLPRQAADLIAGDGRGSSLLVQRNSGVVYARLSEELHKQGVVFKDLHEALQTHGELIRKHFMQVVKPDENRLTAQHAALWSGGLFLYVPRNVMIAEPLQAVFVSDDAAALFSPHVLIIAEAGSSVSYVENVVSAPGSDGAAGSLVHSGIAEVVAMDGARVNFSAVRNLGGHVTDLSYRRAKLGRDAKVQWVIGEMNFGDTLSDTCSILEGSGSISDAKLICVGTGEQKLSITTRAVHIGKSSLSDMVSRAVMRDESTAILNGITKIEKGSTDANGQQTEKVLMLSPKARGDANPMLLIDEDEVKAGHAASVGQVSAEQIYYLMARGISREEATRLIIYGFLSPVVSTIPIEQVEEQLKHVVERKLGQA